MSDPLDQVFRDESGRVLASLIRFTGDFDLAEEALGDALVSAVETWQAGGVPLDPGAWLRVVARNKALDRLRRESRRADRERRAVALSREAVVEEEPHDLLRLIFTCCHPALSRDSQTALCLRAVCGLATAEIARAFLSSEASMAQRISRAKAKIRSAAIPYRIPDEADLPERIDAVLSVVYLLFSTGHHAPFGEAGSRLPLRREAIHMARLLNELMPREPEVLGLLSLLLSTEARSPERLDAEGEAVTLEHQDRSRWDASLIQEASRTWRRAVSLGTPGPYGLQAGISCLHALAGSFEATDWSAIVQLYRQLERLMPGPVVRVNRAVAESWLHGPRVGLALLDELGPRNWAPWWAARADFLQRLDQPAQAASAYTRALSCDLNATDRRLLQRRRAELPPGTPTGAR